MTLNDLRTYTVSDEIPTITNYNGKLENPSF
jgi:hypothetical protein